MILNSYNFLSTCDIYGATVTLSNYSMSVLLCPGTELMPSFRLPVISVESGFLLCLCTSALLSLVIELTTRGNETKLAAENGVFIHRVTLPRLKSHGKKPNVTECQG